MCVCVCTHIHTYIYIHKYIHIRIHTHTHVCVHTYVSIDEDRGSFVGELMKQSEANDNGTILADRRRTLAGAFSPLVSQCRHN